MRVEEAFPQRLKAAMDRKGMNKSQLARAAGCSVHSICGYLLGENLPGAYILAAIATEFGVSCDWLLGLDDTEPELLQKKRRKRVIDQ